MRIFLVEDNEDTRQMLALLLNSIGHDVRTAATMQAALRELPAHGSDVLISDLGLPDGSGWMLLRELRNAGCSPYAVALSGFGALSDVASSMDAGFRQHLVKPIELEALERVLEEARREFDGKP